MYDNQYQTHPRKRIVMIALAILGLIAIVWFLIALLLNGFADTSSITKDEILTFSRIDNGKVAETMTVNPGHTMMRAGDYSVKIAKKDARVYSTAWLHVDNFFRTSKLSWTEKSQVGSQLIFTTAGTSFLTEPSPLTSFRSGGTVVFNDEDPLSRPDDTCERTCMSLYPYDSTRIIGLLGKEDRVKFVATITPPSTSPTRIDDKIYPIKSQLVRSRDDGSFAIYDGKTQLYYYKNTSSAPTTITLERAPATGEDGPLISIANNSVLVVSGQNFNNPTSGDGSGEAATNSPADYRFDNYDLASGKKIGTFTLDHHDQLRSISLSPRANFYTISSLSSLEIGDISSGKISAAQPYNTSQVTWISNDTFMYYDINAIYLSDTTGAAWPIFANNSMNISNVDFVSGKLYATAFFTDDPDQQSNALIIDTSKQAINNSLLSFNPLELTDSYSLRFDGQQFLLYVTTKEDGSKPTPAELQPAYDYIDKVAPNAKVSVVE